MSPLVRLHARHRALASITLVACASLAHAGTTRVPAGSFRLDGHLAGSSVEVSGSGRFGGDGVVEGDLTLATGGTLAPGRRTIVGELGANTLVWHGGGGIAMRLGADDAASDRIALVGALTRQGTGGWTFRFDDGSTPPTAGMTYTLITYAAQTGFSAADFSYAYVGSAPDLIGEFRLDPDALRFVVISTPVQLQSFSID